MPASMRARILASTAIAAFAAAVAGCGGSDSSGPSSVAPADAPLYVEATVRPEGDLQSNIDTLVQEVAGISDAGAALIVALNQQLGEAGDGRDLNYGRDIDPWLGEKAGIFLSRFAGDKAQGVGLAVESTDAAAARQFVDSAAQANDDPVRDGSYEEVEYKVDQSDGSALGVVEDFVVFGEDVKTFKRAVDASDGDSLAGTDEFEGALSDTPEGSLADAYVNAGRLLRSAEGEIDPQAKQALSAFGVDPDAAVVVASLVPEVDRVEIDLRADAGEEPPSTSGAPQLLGSFPADSVGAFAASGLTDELQRAVEQIDRSGVDGTLPQGGLGGGAALAGIDLDEVLASISDVGLFVAGSDEASLGGALAVSFDNADVPRNVAVSFGRLLRGTGAAGVSLIGGKVAGFTLRSADLGRKPAVVLASGDRLAIGYGLTQTRRALAGNGAQPLSGSSAFEAATDALGATPLTGFVDVRAALRLAAGLGASQEQDFAVARQYLDKASYAAIGTSEDGDEVTTKIVVGLP